MLTRKDLGKISAQPHTTLCIQFLNRENNDKNNTFPLGKQICFCSVLRYLSVTIVTLYPVRHDRYMIVKVHSYVKVVLLIPSTVL